MHELSIAQQVIAITKEHLTNERASRVLRIKIRLGEFSCVHQDSLQNAFSMLVQDTTMEKTELVIERIPLAVYCPTCNLISDSTGGVQSLRCPLCDGSTGDIRRGQELELDWIEVASDADFESHATGGCETS